VALLLGMSFSDDSRYEADELVFRFVSGAEC